MSNFKKHGEKEVWIITLFLTAIFAMGIVGIYIPYVDVIMSIVITLAIIFGVAMWAGRRLREQSEWYEALNAPADELKEKYPNEFTSLKREYPPDDYS